MVIIIMGIIVLISAVSSSNPWGIASGLIMVLGGAFFGVLQNRKETSFSFWLCVRRLLCGKGFLSDAQC